MSVLFILQCIYINMYITVCVRVLQHWKRTLSTIVSWNRNNFPQGGSNSWRPPRDQTRVGVVLPWSLWCRAHWKTLRQMVQRTFCFEGGRINWKASQTKSKRLNWYTCMNFFVFHWLKKSYSQSFFLFSCLEGEQEVEFFKHCVEVTDLVKRKWHETFSARQNFMKKWSFEEIFVNFVPLTSPDALSLVIDLSKHTFLHACNEIEVYIPENFQCSSKRIFVVCTTNRSTNCSPSGMQWRKA